MKRLALAILMLSAVMALGDDGRNPADDASERVPPTIVQGQTSDNGPMVWTWDMIKGIFGSGKK